MIIMITIIKAMIMIAREIMIMIKIIANNY